MNYGALIKQIARYGYKQFKKRAVKTAMDSVANTFIDEEDFVSQMLGINTLEGQKKLDNEFSRYIMNVTADDIMKKDVSEWSNDDYMYLRATENYDINWDRRRKVLEYLNYQRKKK
jgi:hypothetical protein